MTEETPPVNSSDCFEEHQAVFNDSSCTHIKQVKCNYTWTVHNFSLRLENTGESLQSPTFSAEVNDKIHKFNLLLFPKGKTRQYKDYLSLFLKLVEVPHGIISKERATFRFSILNLKGEKTVNRVSEGVDLHKLLIDKQGYWGYDMFIDTKSLDAQMNLPDDKLTILCEIRVIFDSIHNKDHSCAMQVIIPKCSVLDDLRLMFENQQLSDLTLSVGGKEFRTHKALLAARSPVFKAMFEHDMEEKKQNRIDISDIDSEVVEEMLCFIYTGKVSIIENTAIKLLAAADKYALETLKGMCEKFFFCSNNLTTRNAIEVLIVADLHTAKYLKAHAINFINRHAKDIMETAEWKLMVETHPYLFEELYKAATQ